jgi:hypothetical protein
MDSKPLPGWNPAKKGLAMLLLKKLWQFGANLPKFWID